jgi:hypothetical protein
VNGVSHLGAPPLVFIGVAQGVPSRQSHGALQNRLLEFDVALAQSSDRYGKFDWWSHDVGDLGF